MYLSNEAKTIYFSSKVLARVPSKMSTLFSQIQ